MAGFLSGETFAYNDIELACVTRRKAGLELIDLSSSNPTIQGYKFPSDILAKTADEYFSKRVYDPNPKGMLSAREAIADYYSKRTPCVRVNPDQIIITASTSESYSLLFSLLCSPGDNILAPNISYPLFEYFGEHHRVQLKQYYIREDMEWFVDYESIFSAKNKRSRAVLIVSPHNPTGCTVEGRNEHLASTGLPVICDEVFAEFTGVDVAAPPIAAFYEDLPVFMLNGISKMFALPDLKLGWIVMNDKAAAMYGERLEILNDAFLGANSLTQYLLSNIFHYGDVFMREMCMSVRAKLGIAENLFSGSKAIDVRTPRAGYYLFPRLLTDCDEEGIVLDLINRGVLVHPGYFYGSVDRPRIMISCLVNQIDLELGIKVLSDYFLARG